MPFERRRSFGDRDRRGGSGGYGGERRWGGGGGGGFGGSRGGFGRSDDEPKPVKEGEEHDVTIAEMSRKGDGIARIQNFVVFVAGTKAGDKVRIRITEVRGRHAIGEVVTEGSGTKLDKHGEGEEDVVTEEGAEEGEEEPEEGEVPEIKEEEEGAA